MIFIVVLVEFAIDIMGSSEDSLPKRSRLRKPPQMEGF